jgi:heme exporter protein B
MQLSGAFQKELLLQWRGKAQFFAVVAFGGITLLLFSFAAGPGGAVLRDHAAGYLWLALLLASTLTLNESFRVEHEHRAMEGMLLLPSSPRALYYAKAVATWMHLMLLGVVLLPLIVILYDADPMSVLRLLPVILLGTAGLAAPGTLHAAMAAGSKARQVLLPLLLFPLVVPVLLASVKASSLALYGDPMGQQTSWLVLLVAFNAIFWSLSGLLFGRVVEE